MVIRSRHQRFAIDRNHLTVILRASCARARGSQVLFYS
jgi:hypothetical protein